MDARRDEASEDTEGGSSSGSEEEEVVAADEHKSPQQTESDADSEEEEEEAEVEAEPIPAPAKTVKRKVAQVVSRAKRSKVGPKGASTAYIYFWQDSQPRLRAENPLVPHKELARLCGLTWKTLSPEEKQPYVDKASADRVRYDAEREANPELFTAEAKAANASERPSKKAAFVLYCKENRMQLKQDAPGHTNQEYRKILGKRWKSLGNDEKKGYHDRAFGTTTTVSATGVVGKIDELLATLRKRVEARLLRTDIGFHEMKGLLEIICKTANYELLRRLDAYPAALSDS